MFLTFDSIENVRDLGGMTRPDGAKIKSGLLLRTGRLSDASDNDLRRLADMGLRLTADFRDPGECARQPDRMVPGSRYCALPALPPIGTVLPPPGSPDCTAASVREGFHEIYRLLAVSENAHAAYKTFFRLVLETRGGCVLWHCTQGKDRTGVAAILMLTALGFEREAILDEYMLTNQFTAGLYEKALASGRGEREGADVLREVFLVYRENAEYFCACAEEEFGSIEGLLEQAIGIGPKERAQLCDYYLE